MNDSSKMKLYEEMKAACEADIKGGMSQEEAFALYKEKYEKGVADLEPATSTNSSNTTAAVAKAHQPLAIGDVVRQKDWGTEGIIIDRTEAGAFVVDRGNLHTEVQEKDLELVISGLECELHDRVKAKPVGGSMFYVGHIIAINRDPQDPSVRTYNVEMMGEADDVEYNVPEANIRKLLSHRLIKRKINKLVKAIHAMGAFGSKNLGHSHSLSLSSPSAESNTAVASSSDGHSHANGAAPASAPTEAHD